MNPDLAMKWPQLGLWMMVVGKDHLGPLMTSFVVLTLKSLVLQLVHCFHLIDPFLIDYKKIDFDVLLRMFYELKLQMHVVLVWILALCHDCHCKYPIEQAKFLDMKR